MPFLKAVVRIVQTAAVCLVATRVLAPASAASVDASDQNATRWWKGNLHTHTLWSDGDDYPEMVAAWYKDHGYHFLALSDHNVMLAGERWFSLSGKRGSGVALEKYVRRFGSNWVERRTQDGTNQVRLKPLEAFRSQLEEADRFLLIPSMEISDRHLTAPVHVNATNLRDLIQPQGGTNVFDVLQRNVNAVLAQRRQTGQFMFPHINHPNFGWAITAEELMRVEGERFFEVFNGHPSVRNAGDPTHAGVERVWDIVLTWRVAVLNLPVMYGLGVDDSHDYHVFNATNSNSGRGWVMVRAERLNTESILQALEDGDFYASSGVTLREVRYGTNGVQVEIATEPGVTYRTQFIGTRRGFNRQNEPMRTVGGEALRVTHRYSDDVGRVLAETTGSSAHYSFRGDELYVRAKIISSKPHRHLDGEFESAWIQPVVP